MCAHMLTHRENVYENVLSCSGLNIQNLGLVQVPFYKRANKQTNSSASIQWNTTH